ncbi:hypothetical protein L6V77_29925 [Myxococcota bacterium]|nr:hypothetical protein [Myxococcota bacterium]
MKKLLAALADAHQTETLVGLAFDFAMTRSVGEFVRPERVLAHLDRALDEALTETALRTHLRPALDREVERARRRDDRVGDWLTAEAKAELRALAARPVKLDRRFIEGLVKQEAISDLVRSVVEETLDRFLQTLKPGGSGGGVFGAVGRSAVGIASGFGKGLLGGIGAQMESQLKGAAATFIAGSMHAVMDRVVAILTSPETGAKLARMNVGAFDKAMEKKTHELAAAAMKLPVDDLLDVVPGLIAHNLARPDVREGLLEELAAALAIEGERTLGDILTASRDLDAWRTEVIEIGAPLVREFAATPAFKAWLGDRGKA